MDRPAPANAITLKLYSDRPGNSLVVTLSKSAFVLEKLAVTTAGVYVLRAFGEAVEEQAFVIFFRTPTELHLFSELLTRTGKHHDHGGPKDGEGLGPLDFWKALKKAKLELSNRDLLTLRKALFLVD